MERCDAGHELLDATMIAELRALGADEFDGLIRMFLEDGTATIAALRTARAAGRSDEVAALAHALKGTASTFGADVLAARCAELQRHAASDDTSTLQRLVVITEEAFGRVSDALRLELRRAPDALGHQTDGSVLDGE